MIKRFLMLLLLSGMLLITNSSVYAKDNSIKVFKLRDGQTVVIKEVHTNPIVTIDTWVKTGSINENDKNNGVSHFLEHLLFKGTSKHPAGDLDKFAESKGAIFNAATSKDFTHFFITIASPHAEKALELHSDMVLHAAIPLDDLEKERMVVLEEIRRSEDNPNRILYDNMNSLLFRQHPYKYETIGSMKTVGALTRNEILDYYHKWYVPANMITVIVGDIDTNKILKLVKQDFEDNSVYNHPTKVNYEREPSLEKSVEKKEKGDYNTGYMVVSYKGVDIKDKKGNYALDLAALILGSGRSSRLYQDIKEKQNLVSSIGCDHYSMKDDSIFSIDADYNPENFIALKKAILKEVKMLRETKVSNEELQRAKTQLERQFKYSQESVGSIATSIGYDMTIGGNIGYYTNYIDDINKITAEDIQKVAQKYLVDSKVAVSALLPEEGNFQPVTKTQESYKSVSKQVLNNNLTLITEKNDSNDIISLSVFFKGGKLVEQAPGISELIESTMMKGTVNRTGIEISKELENSGIIISPSANPDYFEIQLKSTAEDFDKAFEVLAEIIKNPMFKAEDIEKAKKDIIEGIQESRDNPSSVAFEEFEHEMYPNHPYGYNGKVLEKSIPKIERNNIVSFYKENFIPQNMIVSVSGNINKDDLVEKFSSFGVESSGKVVNIDNLKEQYRPLSQDKFVPVSKKTSAAWMVMGWPVNGISNPKDYASLKIINAILGNGMSSRLFVDLREKQGLAYEVNAIYPTRLENSYFVLYIGTDPKNLVIAKNGFLKEISRIKSEAITDKELSDAKQKLVGQFALSQETNGQKAHNLGWFETIGKGYKFNYEYPELINSVTIDDVMNTANKYFNNSYILSVVAPNERVKDIEKEYSK